MPDRLRPRALNVDVPTCEILLSCKDESIDKLTGLAIIDEVPLLGDEARGAVDAYLALPDKAFVQRMLERRMPDSPNKSTLSFHLEVATWEQVDALPRPPRQTAAIHLAWAIDSYIIARLNEPDIKQKISAHQGKLHGSRVEL